MNATTVTPANPCVGCGLCCDGTLHARTGLTPTEGNWLTRRGYRTEIRDDALFLNQPCPMSKCGSCTIYEDRFATCRTFRCALLMRVDAGEIAAQDACNHVTVAKQLLGAVMADDPQSSQLGYRLGYQQECKTAFENGDAATRQAMAPRLIRIMALEVYLDKWFRTKKVQGEVADKAE